MAVRETAFLVVVAIISQSAAVDFCKLAYPRLSTDFVVLNITYTNFCEDPKMYGINATAGAASCSYSESFSNLTLNGNDTNGVAYTLSFLYTKAGNTWSTNITFSVEIEGLPHIDPDICKGPATGYVLQNATYLGSNVGQGSGFRCSQGSAGSNGTSCSNVNNVNVTLSNWSVQPFSSTGGYATCSPDVTSIVVPIAVGAALAGLVVLVIVVWVAGKLWERYKAKKTGGAAYDKL